MGNCLGQTFLFGGVPPVVFILGSLKKARARKDITMFSGIIDCLIA